MRKNLFGVLAIWFLSQNVAFAVYKNGKIDSIDMEMQAIQIDKIEYILDDRLVITGDGVPHAGLEHLQPGMRVRVNVRLNKIVEIKALDPLVPLEVLDAPEN